MSFDDFVFSLLDQHYYRTAAKLIIWGMACVILLALISLVLPSRRASTKLAWTGTCIWVGIFVLAYLDQYASECISSYRVRYERQVYCILPTWLCIGLAVLWGAFGLRWLIDKRSGLLDKRRRGFPLDR